MTTLPSNSKTDLRPFSRSLTAALAGGDSWTPPAVISLALQAEARRALAAMEGQFSTPSRQAVRDWLASLGVLCAGSMPAQDARMRIDAYAGLLEHPAGCFSEETLKAAARRFRWFPAFAEVAEYLDYEMYRLKARRSRLERIARGSEKPAPAPRLSAENRARLQAMVGEVKRVPREPTQAEFEAQKAAVLAECAAAGMTDE